jgi:hypothetical protein
MAKFPSFDEFMKRQNPSLRTSQVPQTGKMTSLNDDQNQASVPYNPYSGADSFTPPSWEEYAGSQGIELETIDPLTQLMQGIMGQDSKTNFNTISDDSRNWISAAYDYAKATGYWPQWDWLTQFGVPAGTPYYEPDTSDVIGITDEYTAPMFGGQAGMPVTQNMFNALQGNQDFQALSDETRVNSQIAKIMEGTGYDYDTAKYIYTSFMNEPADMPGTSSWAKQSYTPDQVKNFVKNDTGTEDVPKPYLADESLKDFFRTFERYNTAEKANPLGSPTIESADIGEQLGGSSLLDKAFAEPLEYFKDSGISVNTNYLANTYWRQTVDLVNQIADEARSKGDLATILNMVRDAEIGADSTFNLGESMSALKYLSNTDERAKALYDKIVNDPNMYQDQSSILNNLLRQFGGGTSQYSPNMFQQYLNR